MNNSHEYLSKSKFGELTRELDELKNAKRKEIAESLEYARSLGDLSENAEYHQARELQAKTEERIFQLEAMLKTAVIVKKHKSEIIEVGATITVKKNGEKDKIIFDMVGSEEADSAAGKISLNSPLGESLMGKKKGEVATFKAPSGKEIKYTIVKID